MTDKKVEEAVENSNTFGNLREAVALLKECQPLVTRLIAHGVTITLSKPEEASLLGFQDIESRGYSDRDWSYLRMASGVQLSGIAALNNCLLHYHQTHNSNS